MAEKNKSTASSYGWVVLAVVFLAGFTAPANMAKVTALAPVIMMEFGILPDTLGWIIALFYVLGFIMAFPTAGLINKFGLRIVISSAVICGFIGSIMGALSTGTTLFMVSRFLEGAGMGVMGVAGASAIAPWFPTERRGFPLGIWAMWVALAMCICPILFGWIVETLGQSWHVVWWGAAAFDIVVLVIFNIFYREPEKPFETDDDKKTGKAIFSRALKNPMLWTLGFIFLFDEAAFMAINGFLTTYLTEQLATTLVFATGIASTAAVLGTIFAPVAGKVSDWLKTRKWVLLFGLIGGVAYTAVVFTAQNPDLYWGIVILGGIAGGMVPSIIWAATPDTVEADDVPVANATVAFMQNFGMFMGAMVMGNAIVSFGWSTASFAFLVPCYVICIILLFAGLRKLR